MRTIAFVNKKGGVGKTRSAVETAYILAVCYQQRVLLVDMDGQGNATDVILGRQGSGSVAALLSNLATCYDEVTEKTDIPNLDIIPASEELDQLDLEFMMGEKRPGLQTIRDMRMNIEEDDAYDIMVIDCPPHYSAGCINAIAAADTIVIPTTTDAFATTGMDGLIGQIENIRKICPTVRVAGCLVTRYSNDAVDQDAVNYLREEAPVRVFDTVIRESTEKVKGSSWAGKTSQEWSPWCNTSRDYRSFVAELVRKEGLVHVDA